MLPVGSQPLADTPRVPCWAAGVDNNRIGEVVPQSVVGVLLARLGERSSM